MIINQVTLVVFIRRPEEVIETDLVKGRSRLVRGHVATQFKILLRSTQHHHDSVPSDDGTDASLDGDVPGVGVLLGEGDGVAVLGVNPGGQVHPVG